MRQALRIPVLGAVAGLLFSAVACGGSSYGSGGGGNNPPYTPPAAGLSRSRVERCRLQLQRRLRRRLADL